MNKKNLIMEVNLEAIKNIKFNTITFLNSDIQIYNKNLNQLNVSLINDELLEADIKNIKDLSSIAIIDENGTSLLIGQPINDMGFHFEDIIPNFVEVKFNIETLKEHYLQKENNKER